MATEEQKKQRLIKVFNIGMYGMIKGIWEMMGPSSFAATRAIGEKMLDALEKESGLEIQGEEPEDILMEIVRLLTDEVGTMSEGAVTVDGNKVSLACRHCFLREATGWLEEETIEPFACLPMNIAGAAMRKRLGTKHRHLGRHWDSAAQTCTINFELIE